MSQDKPSHSEKAKSFLYRAFLSLKTPEDVRRFLRDLCTPSEIEAMAERLHIALLLYRDGLSYRDISAKTGASTTTVARVARFLTQEDYQGYKAVLESLEKDIPDEGDESEE